MARYSSAKHGLAAALFALLSLAPTIPAYANGEILITQAKANAGNVTPGDSPGFPVTLSLPGSYQLASNLAVPAGSFGIHITAHDVTIDLNGFRIHGSSTANHGIYGKMNSATIRNGTVALFKFHGIYLTGDYAIVENMRSVVNGSYGIALIGRSSLIQDNVVSKNFDGILINDGVAQGNVVSLNTRRGIQASGSTVLGNSITSNGSYGLFGTGGLAGYGNNTLVGNNNGQAQVIFSVVPLHPNACSPAC